MTKKEAIKLFEEKKVRAMMEYKVSAGNKLKHRLTQIFAKGNECMIKIYSLLIRVSSDK